MATKTSKNYRLLANEQDPKLRIPLPPELIKDLVKRSRENGQTVEVEIAMRIARSLEDVEILETDLQNFQEQQLAAKKAKKLASIKKAKPKIPKNK
jgi:hypothetical protein